MISLNSDISYFNLVRTMGFDKHGQTAVEIDMQPGYKLLEMESDIISLKARISELTIIYQHEAELRAKNPALRDLYDQYKTVLTLVETKNDEKGN